MTTQDNSENKKISAYASKLMAGNDLRQAENILRDAIARFPDDPFFHYQMGGCLDRQAKRATPAEGQVLIAESAKYFRASSDLKKHDFYAANMAGRRLLQCGDTETAFLYAARAVNLRNNDEGAWRQYHRISEALGLTSRDLGSLRGMKSTALGASLLERLHQMQLPLPMRRNIGPDPRLSQR